MRRIIIAVVVLAVLGVGGYFGYTSFVQSPSEDEGDSEISLDDIQLEVGVEQVTAEGEVVPLESINLAFQIPGTVVEVLVDEGDVVTAGTELIILEDADQRLALAQAEAALTQAEANVGSAEANVQSAEASKQAAEAGVMVAEAQLAVVSADPTDEQIAVSQSQVAQSEAAIAQAQGQLVLASEGATQAQIAAAQADLEAAEAALLPIQIQLGQLEWFGIDLDDDAQRALDLQLNAANENVRARQEILNDLRNGARASNVNAAAEGVQAAEANKVVSEAQLDLLLAGTREEQIEIARTGVVQAQNGVTEADLSIAQANAALDQAKTAVTEAEKNVEAAQIALSRTILTAPIDGTVATIQPKVGEVIQPGLPVSTMADIQAWQVETTDLTELGIVNVEVGLPVEVTIDAFPGETIQGEVADISSTSERVLGDVTYRVTVDLLDDDALDLRWGMTAFVKVDVE